MRNLRVVMALLLLVIAACGDSSTEDVEAGGAPPPDASAPSGDVALWLSATRLPPGSADVAAVLVNTSGDDLVFGVGAEVERWDGEEWIAHGSLVMCLDHWHCSGEILTSAGEVAVPSIGLVPTPDMPGPFQRFSTVGLEPGWYRVSQAANEGAVARGVFEIADGAPAPLPLPPVDQPAISVQPPLVPAEGGTVTLNPLIPSPSGSQTLTDVVAAVEGLGEMAAIERWDGDGWVAVSDVDLTPVADEPRIGRSAAIPALEPGTYRLVRTGGSLPHTGVFWALP